MNGIILNSMCNVSPGPRDRARPNHDRPCPDRSFKVVEAASSNLNDNRYLAILVVRSLVEAFSSLREQHVTRCQWPLLGTV